LQRPTKAGGSPGQIPGVNDRDESLVVVELRAARREFIHFVGEYLAAPATFSRRPSQDFFDHVNWSVGVNLPVPTASNRFKNAYLASEASKRGSVRK